MTRSRSTRRSSTARGAGKEESSSSTTTRTSHKESSPPSLAPAPNITPRSTRGRTPRAASSRKKQPWEESDEDDLDNHNQHEDDEEDFIAPKYTPGKRGRPRKAPQPPPTDDDEDTSEQEDENDNSDASVNSDDDEEEEEEEDEDELDDDMDDEESPRRSLRMTIRVPQIPKYLTEEAEKEIPQLTLPHSSDDLVIKKELILDALTVYEVLRHFSKCLRLTPFRFEDFCASLIVDEQNILLSEIHMSLLKALIREDETQGTHYVPTDLKDSVVINFFFMDHFTWPESLRLFLSTDLKTNNGILKECFEDPQNEGKEYPFVLPGIRLKLLRHLTDLFLQTGPPREDVFNEGVIKHDDHCRYCQRLGELICCEQCPATYHLGCIDPPLNEVPGDDWICPVCEANTISGISDCISSYEKSGLLCRQEPLGWDRHGRRYWFLARRIVVESEDGKECWYYSTKLQLQKLLDSLDGEDLEADLVRTIEEGKEEIHRQFDITEQLTNSARQGRKSYIMIDNERLTKELEEKIKKEEEKKATEEKSKMEVEDGDSKSVMNGSVNGESSKSNDTSNIDMKEEGDKKDESSPENDIKKTIQTRLKTGSIQLKPINLDPLKRVTPNGTPDVTGATGGDIYVYSKDGESLTRVSKRHLLSTSSLLSNFVFKLGMEIPPMTRSYVNYYNVMPIALNRHQHQEERDRRRHLSHKFSLTPASEYKWQPSTALTGSRNVMLSTLRQTIIHLEQQLPPCLLHPNWPVHRENWEKAVKMCTTAKDFSLALCILESSMKPVLMTGAWNEALGFTHFHRTTQQEREEAKKGERREGKSTRKSKADQSKGEGEGEEDATEGLYKLNQYVHYVFGKLKHQIWKQKGEEYRLSGKGGWSWLSKTRRFQYKRYSKPAPVEIIELTDEQQDQVKNAALINISQELRTKPAERTFYSSVYTGCWNVSSTEKYSTKYKNNMKIIDGFLERRQIQKEIEEREAKIKKEKEEAETSKMDVDEETGLGDPILSKCYSPSCDGAGECYSVTCVREQKIREEKKQKEEEERKAKEQQEKDSETSEVAHCQDKVSLHRFIPGADGVPQLVKRIAVKSKTLSKGSLPPCHRFITKMGKQTSILVLPDYELKKLARCGSLREVTGFNYNCKLNPVIWPYHTTPRPVLRTTWLYRNQNLFTIHSVALQLKILWASVRWDDLQQKPPPSGANTITTETEVITTEILKRREVPPFGIRSEYLIRRIIVPIELPSNKPREKSAPIRSGLRERKRAESPQNRGPSMTESWHAEEELEIWELKQFGEKVEKTLKEQKERERIAELRGMRPQSTADRQKAEELLRQKIGTAKGLTNTPAGVKTRISNLIQSKVAQQAQGSYAMIKTVGGQMFKVPISALAGKTVGQTIVIKTGQSGANNLTTTAATIMSMHAAPPIQTTPKTGTTVTQSVTTTGPQATIAPSTPQQVIIRAPNIPAGQTVVIRQPTVTTPAGQRVQIIRPAATAGTPVAGRTLVSATPGQQVVHSPQQQTAGTPMQMVTIPVKLANGNTHLIQIPISMIGANQQLQIAVQPTPQAPGQQTIQIIATPQQPQPQPAAAAGGQQIRIVGTPTGTPKVVQIRQQTQPIVVATSTAQNVSAPPSTPVQQQTTESVINQIKTDSILVQQSPTKVSTGRATAPLTSTTVASPTTPSGESPSSSGFVLTSQVTSEILRNAVMNANLSVEMQQKLLAAQKMYSETNYSQVLIPVSPSKVTPKRTSGRERTPKRLDPDMIKTPVFPTSYDGKREPDPQAVARGKASALKRKLVAEELERQRKEKEAIWNALPPEQREEMEREDDVRSIMKFMLDRVERNERLELKRKRNREQAHQHRWKVATSRLESILHRQTEMLKNEMKTKKINFEVEYGKEVDLELENLLGRKITKEEIPPAPILKPIIPDQVVIAAPATTHVTPLTEHSQRSGSTSVVKSAPPPPPVTPIQQRVPPITISADQIPKPPQLTPSPAKKATHVTTKESPQSSKAQTMKKTAPTTASSTPKKRMFSGTPKSTGKKSAPSASANPQPSTSTSQPAIPSTSSEGEPAAKRKLYCICQTPYDTTRLMVGCDSCNNWFHADCIGLSESDVEQLDAYVCKNCQEEDDQVNGEFPSVDVSDIIQEEVVVDSSSKGKRKDGSGDELELYCLCRQPYDESQFYICCDSCQDWFHGRCVGVLQKEADKIDVYVCPNCQKDSAINHANLKFLDVVDLANLKILLNEIKKHRSSWPFLEPVDAKEVPDYYKVIKEPMDLKNIEHKLSTKQYTKLAQFIGDVTKMFDNCRYYNGPKTTFYNCAESLEGFFVNKIKAFREKMA